MALDMFGLGKTPMADSFSVPDISSKVKIPRVHQSTAFLGQASRGSCHTITSLEARGAGDHRMLGQSSASLYAVPVLAVDANPCVETNRMRTSFHQTSRKTMKQGKLNFKTPSQIIFGDFRLILHPMLVGHAWTMDDSLLSTGGS